MTSSILLRCTLCASLLVPALTALARTPDDLEALQRETRITADVMKAVLREGLRDETRITKVTADYLADQGVLINVVLNSPWLSISEDARGVEISGQISISDIPPMVEDILNDLQIDIAPYEPEALEELRELRAEQREMRLEQREIRARLREKRRALVRSDDGSGRETLERDIAQYERDLKEADAQYDNLSVEIDEQYERLRDYRDGQRRPRLPPPDAELGLVIAQCACDYGPTLSSLDDDERLSFALHNGDTRQYYVFRMDDVIRCSRSDMAPGQLLERAYQYGSGR